MQSLAAFVFSGLCAVLVVFHLCIILGAPWGHLTMGGRWKGALPPVARGLSLVSGLLLAGMSFAVLSLAGLTGWAPPTFVLPALGAYSVLAILAHVATPSAPERRLWLPVILLMCAALGVVAWG